MKLHSFLTTLAYDTHSIPYVTLKKKRIRDENREDHKNKK